MPKQRKPLKYRQKNRQTDGRTVRAKLDISTYIQTVPVDCSLHKQWESLNYRQTDRQTDKYSTQYSNLLLFSYVMFSKNRQTKRTPSCIY